MADPDWQNKKRKYKCTKLIKKDYNNIIAWQINSWEKLLIKIDIDPNRVLSMILNMQKIYIEYFDQFNKADS